MAASKSDLLAAIERDREEIIAFLSGFVRAKSPNPPGDTTHAVAYLTRFLEAEKLPFRLVAPEPTMANIVGSFEGGAGRGRHLVLNGHVDVFPVDATETWTQGPWSGAIADGKIWGRGVADMKAGTSASVFTYRYLYRIRDALKGKLTLTCVSDEETFGPWGARWLMENEPEVLGDCCLNGEPSSPLTVRFGEKAPLWLKITVRTPGAHGAYTHACPSATKIAAEIIRELECLTSIATPAPAAVAAALAEGAAAMDRAMGAGAAQIAQRLTLNIGRIEGGLKVNMIPGVCSFEADVRLPLGYDKEHVMAEIRAIIARHPQATLEEINASQPAWCDPSGPMMAIIRANVKDLRGFEPMPAVSLGGTDARLWRQRGIPAYVYGPFPTGMGSKDEAVPIDDYLHVVRTHVLSAFDYLTA
jgi:succinyl-diaminopimelate desuccinylase